MNISDENLLHAYQTALRLELSNDFIQLLETEIEIRRLIHTNHFITRSNINELSMV